MYGNYVRESSWASGRTVTSLLVPNGDPSSAAFGSRGHADVTRAPGLPTCGRREHVARHIPRARNPRQRPPCRLARSLWRLSAATRESTSGWRLGLQLEQRPRDVLDRRQVRQHLGGNGDAEAILDVRHHLHHAKAVEPEVVLDVVVRANGTIELDMAG